MINIVQYGLHTLEQLPAVVLETAIDSYNLALEFTTLGLLSMIILTESSSAENLYN